MSLETLNVKFNADVNPLQRGFKQALSGVKSLNAGFSGLIKTAASLAGISLGVKAIADSFKSFTALESNMNRTSDIFGAAALNVQAFAEGSAKAFGLAETAVYEYASTYGNLFKNITASSVENSAVTIQMLKASAVVASKTGRSMEDVMSRIRSGLLGNTEAIEDLGINVNVAMLEMTDAFKRIADGRSWNQLNFYEQQQVRTLGILEQAHKNFGDEVQGGTAFSLSVLSSAFKDLMSTAGSFVNAALKPIIAALTTIVQAATSALKALSALFGFNATLNISGVEEAGAGAGEIADGVGEAAKNAKKLNRQLTGIDALNDITKNDTSSAASALESATGAGSGMGIELDFEELQAPDTSWTDSLTKWLSDFSALLAPAKAELSALWDVLKQIGGFAGDGLRGFYEGFLKPVGVWVLGEGLPRLVRAFKEGLETIQFERINAAFAALWEQLAPFAINVGEGLLWFWENVLVPFGTWTMNELLPAFLNLLSSALSALNPLIEALKPLGIWLWEKFLQPLAAWTGEVVISALDRLSEGLTAIGDWISTHQSAVQNIALAVGTFAAVVGTANAAIMIWNTVGAVATTVTKGFSAAMAFLAANPIVLVIAAVAALVAGIVLLVRNWDTVKEAALNVWAKIKSAWGAAGDWFDTNVVQPIAGFFGGLWNGIKEGGSAMLTFLEEHVITPVVNAFKGLYNGVVGIIEGVINAFIGVINGFISGINLAIAAINLIPGVGLRPLTMLPQVSVPRMALANGGIAYGEIEALVGDNFNARQDPEIIAPLSRLQDMITSAMLQHDIATGGNGEVHVVMQLESGETLVDMMIDPVNKTAKNKGYNPVFVPR